MSKQPSGSWDATQAQATSAAAAGSCLLWCCAGAAVQRGRAVHLRAPPLKRAHHVLHHLQHAAPETRGS